MGDDAEGRLDELAERYRLSAFQRDRLTALLAVVGCDGHAPTAIKDPLLATDVHLADSLAALELGVFGDGQRLVDIGAGAGFPGLPLAIACPASSVVLVDSQMRKCAFMGRAAASSKLTNAEVVCRRIEEWNAGFLVHDIALARALAPQPVVLEYAAPLLRLGGLLIDWRGRRDSEEEAAADCAAVVLGMKREQIVRTVPFSEARDRHLHVFVKAEETPSRFPRRAGVARKRPLGC